MGGSTRVGGSNRCLSPDITRVCLAQGQHFDRLSQIGIPLRPTNHSILDSFGKRETGIARQSKIFGPIARQINFLVPETRDKSVFLFLVPETRIARQRQIFK